MPLAIYGSPRSRTMRVLWVAAELGLEYEHVPLAFDDPALKAPAFLKLNPRRHDSNDRRRRLRAL